MPSFTALEFIATFGGATEWVTLILNGVLSASVKFEFTDAI